MGTARLGNYSFRLDPDQIHYDYKIDYSVIDTLGGQVVQVLGATVGDITITGSFGQDHKTKANSWQLAESFHAAIKGMIDNQTLPKQGKPGFVHQPIRFTYMDGKHNWDFKVLIKNLSDADASASVQHATGKFSYHYTLTLFLVEDSTLSLKKISTDAFISRISNGLGWKRSGFNGSMNLASAIDYIQSHSNDGSLNGFFVQLLEGGSTPDPTNAVNSAGPGTAE